MEKASAVRNDNYGVVYRIVMVARGLTKTL